GKNVTSISHSLVQGQSGGSNGNVDGSVNPLFVNAPAYTGGPFTVGDYTVMSCSPVIDAGSDADNTTSTDLKGNSRRFGVIDIGAYELQTTATIPTLSPANQQITTHDLNNSSVTFADNCNVLAALESMGDRPVAGEVTAKVWVD